MTERKTGTNAISDEAVKAKTGQDWAGWFAVLDAFDVAGRGHAAAARFLEAEYGVSGWWAQSITVRYEQARGLREVRQQAGGKFGVAVQRTIAAPAEALWRALGEPGELAVGEVTHAEPPTRMRRRWNGGRIELTLTAKAGKTTLRLQHEGIASKAEADAMKLRWTAALDALKARLER